MKRFLKWLGGILVVLLLLLVAIPYFIPTGFLTEKVVSLVKVYTGRDLVIKGETHLTLLPSVGLDMSDVTFSGAKGGKYPQMVSLETLSVGVGLMPLLSGKVDIEKFVLNNPVISLEVLPSGKTNWEFEPETVAEAATETPTEVARAEEVAEAGDPLAGVSIHGIDISNATVRYYDATTKSLQEVKGLSINIGEVASHQPLEAMVELSYLDRPISVDLTVSDLTKLLLQEEVSFEAQARAKNILFKAAGNIDTQTLQKEVNVSSSLQVDNLKDILTWVGVEAPDFIDNFAKVGYQADLTASQTKFSLKKAKITAGDVVGNGSVSVDISKKKPTIVAKLSLNQIDIDDFSKSGDTVEEKVGDVAETPSGEKIVWSKDPIDFSALSLVNATADLTIEKLILPKITITNAAVQSKVQEGVLTTKISSDPIFSGIVGSSLKVDSTPKVPTISLITTAEKLNIGDALQTLADQDSLTGQVKADLSFSSEGHSVDSLVRALDGKGTLALTNGVLKGVDVAASVNRVKSGQSGVPQEGDQTEIKDLSMSFTMTDSVMETKDLKIKAKYVDIPIVGIVNIYEQTQNITAKPTLNEEYTGKGQMLVGVALPLQVAGTWYNPEVKVSLEKVILGVLASQVGNIVKTPEKAVKGILNGGGALGKGLLEGGGSLLNKLK